MRNLALSFNLIIAICLVGSCGPSAREKLIAGTFTSVNAIVKAEEVYSAQAQLDIVKQAPDKATAEAQIAGFQAKRAKIERVIAATYIAIATAAALQDDPKSLDNLKAAAAVLIQEAAAFLPQKGTP